MDQVEQSVASQAAEDYREMLLADPWRPGYHFVLPQGIGIPGDPNGAFYQDGRYHLMYLYHQEGKTDCWGHCSSHDLVHWRCHPDALKPDEQEAAPGLAMDYGIYSGGAFADDDGRVYLSYWSLPVPGRDAGGIRIARSVDKECTRFEKYPDYAIRPTEELGILELGQPGEQPVGVADPSNIWKKDGLYYMQTGNLLALNKYGRTPDAPANLRGDWVDLFCSADLEHWEFVRRFYERRQDNAWTREDEDDMCPSFLPLPSSKEGGEPSGKYLQLFLAHNRGCQYYMGEYDREGDCFLPERHGRMSWNDTACFAPEALIDGKGRQILWVWLNDNPPKEEMQGWSGVYTLPRLLWLRPDGQLGIAPPPELETLRVPGRECTQVLWRGERLGEMEVSEPLEGVAPLSCEVILEADPKGGLVGAAVRCAPDGSEYTLVYYDARKQELVIDTTHSGTPERRLEERAPLALEEGEKLTLRVYVDRPVIEAFANDRQAVVRRTYPRKPDSIQLRLLREGGASVDRMHAYELSPSNPY